MSTWQTTARPCSGTFAAWGWRASYPRGLTHRIVAAHQDMAQVEEPGQRGGAAGAWGGLAPNLSAPKPSLGNCGANARQHVSDMWSPAGRRKPCICYHSLPHRGSHICPRNSRLDPHIERSWGSWLLPLSWKALRCLWGWLRRKGAASWSNLLRKGLVIWMMEVRSDAMRHFF